MALVSVELLYLAGLTIAVPIGRGAVALTIALGVGLAMLARAWVIH